MPHRVRQYLVRAVDDLPRGSLLQRRALIAETLDVHVERVLAERRTNEQVQLHSARHHPVRFEDTTKGKQQVKR